MNVNSTLTDTAAALLHGQFDDIGKRPNQEDRWVVREFQTADGRLATLAIVADGIGGHNTGEIASQMAAELIPAHLLSRPPAASELTSRLKAALEETSWQIYNASLTDPNRSGMGTTCTAVVIVDRRLHLAHVGDSRLYLLRAGQLRQLTVDHTWAEEALRAGRPLEEIRAHPNRGVIMRYLGIDPTVSIDTRYRVNDKETADALAGPLYLEPGDTLLLCTDGVSDALDPQFIAEFMAYPDCQVAAKTLVESALRAGATDNVTAVVLRLPGGVVIPPPSAARKKLPLMPILLGALALVALGVVVALAIAGRDGGQSAAAPSPIPMPGATMPIAVAATQPPTATPRPIVGGGVSVLATPISTSAVAAPTLPTQSTAQQITETQTSAVEQPSHDVPTLIPTFTPQQTRMTVTQTAATVQRPTANTPTNSVSDGGGMVDLINPPDGAKIIGSAEFKWRPQSTLRLQPGQRYELIVWGEGEDPFSAGRSPVGSTNQTEVTANLTGGEAALGLTPGRTYYWGVRLVTADGKPIRMLSDGRKFVYERASSEGGQPPLDCEGTDCDK